MAGTKVDSIKFKPKELDDMLEGYYTSRKILLKTTIRYLYSLKEDKDFTQIISINSTSVYVDINKIFWIVTKYRKIAKELIEIRGRVIHHLFDEFSADFDEDAMERLVKNPSNVWLETKHQKINVLKNYCDELLTDTYFIESVCSKGISIEQYEQIHEECRNVFDYEIKKVWSIAIRHEMDDKYILETNKKIISEISMESYKESFNDMEFLEK